MYLFFLLVSLLIIICVIRYIVKVHSRSYKILCQYPPCLREMPIVGSFYHFLFESSEVATNKLLEMGYNTMKAGGIARFYGFKTFYLVLTDASDITEVMTKCLNKAHLYKFIQVVTGNGSVFAPDSSISKVRRRVLLQSFTPKILSSYIDNIREESVKLTEVLAPYVGKGPFAAGSYLGAYAINNVLRAAEVQHIGNEISTLKMLDGFHRSFELVYKRWFSIWMHSDFLYNFTSNHEEIKELRKSFQNYADKILETRKNKLLSENSNLARSDHVNGEQDKTLKCIFDGLINSHLTRKEITEEIIVMVGASEEAGQVIGFALILLGLYPSIQEKAYEELDDIFGDSNRPLEKDDLMKMRYLDMVIKEVFRLYPPVPTVFRKAQQEMKLRRIIPAGTSVMVPIISLHRNPKYWGPDAEHFDPDRFLPERLAGVPDNALMPFSSGPRSCVGYKFGTYLVKVALCSILRKYKVVGKPASSPVPDIRLKFQVTLKCVNDFEIELENRM